MRLNHGSLERDDPRQRLRVNIERIIKGIKGKAVGKIAWPWSDKHPERVISQILLEIEGRGCRTVKTKDEAQAIVTTEVNAAKTAWDNNNVEGESSDEKIERLGSKPADITLVE